MILRSTKEATFFGWLLLFIAMFTTASHLLLIDVTYNAFILPTLALELRFLATGGGVEMRAAIRLESR